MAEAGLLAGLELVVWLVLVLVHVLQEVRSQGRRGWMRKIGVDHNTLDPLSTIHIQSPQSYLIPTVNGFTTRKCEAHRRIGREVYVEEPLGDSN